MVAQQDCVLMAYSPWYFIFLSQRKKFERSRFLGNRFLAKKDFKKSEFFYKKMIGLFPNQIDGYINLAYLFIETSHPDKAHFYLLKAEKIDPCNVDILFMLARIKQLNQQIDDSVIYYQKALELSSDSQLCLVIADAVSELNVPAFRLACLHKAKSLTADNKHIQFKIDSAEGSTPHTAPTEYVTKLFDHYAGHFEKNLVEDLRYCAPEKLINLLKTTSIFKSKNLTAIDLGCGTGLVGYQLKPYVQKIIGVDLSTKMLQICSDRHIYTELINLDIATMLKQQSENFCHIIIAADVFIYVGKLDAVFNEIQRVLCPGGVFVFSLESQEDNESSQEGYVDFKLNSTERYSHSANYIKKLAAVNKLTVVQMNHEILRYNLGKPVMGWYALCEKPCT